MSRCHVPRPLLLPSTLLICLASFLGGCVPRTWSRLTDAVEFAGPPRSPDAVMDRFRAAQEGLDLEAYGKLLHREFAFVFQEEDIRRLQIDDADLTRDEELEVSARMFSGRPCTGRRGRSVPGLAAIVFERFEGLGRWTYDDDPLLPPGVKWRTYAVRVRFEWKGGRTTTVRGEADFYVLEQRPAMGRSDRLPRWQLVGWVDRTEQPPRPPRSWQEVTSLYR